MPQGGLAMEAVDNPFFEIKLNFAQDSREVVRLLNCDAHLRSQRGDHDGAAESCQAILNTGRSLKDQPFLISQLVRIAIQHIGVSALERTLGQGEVSDANLAKLQELLAKEAADDAFHHAMRGERAGGHQVYQLLREGKVTISEIFGGTRMKGTPPGPGERLLDVFPGIVLGAYPDYLRSMNEQVRASKLKDVERSEAMKKIDDKLRKNRTLLSSMIMPATGKVGDATQRSQALLRCSMAGLAVERYRLKNKHWPATLGDVVKAGLLKEIPPDPYAGQPLRFAKTPTGVVVYSVGPDKIDNAGTLNRKNPMAAGSDYGFELWEPPQMRGIAPPADVAKD